MARGRPSRATVYARLDSQLAELRSRFGGLPSPEESAYVWADIWHLEAHHSTALEGNTLILREVETLLDQGKAVGAKPLREYMEVKGYGDAASWVYREAMGAGDRTADTLITVQEIRHIHHLAMTLVWQVSPYPDASEAESPGNFRRHDIHPFIDGNGRAGRLALNLVLVRLGYPPVVILKEQRAAYLRAMQQADKGDTGPLGEILARETRPPRSTGRLRSQPRRPARSRPTRTTRRPPTQRRPMAQHAQSRQRVQEVTPPGSPPHHPVASTVRGKTACLQGHLAAPRMDLCLAYLTSMSPACAAGVSSACPSTPAARSGWNARSRRDT